MEKNPEIEVQRLTAVASAMGWEMYGRSVDESGNTIISFRLVTQKAEAEKPTEIQPALTIPT